MCGSFMMNKALHEKKPAPREGFELTWSKAKALNTILHTTIPTVCIAHTTPNVHVLYAAFMQVELD